MNSIEIKLPTHGNDSAKAKQCLIKKTVLPKNKPPEQMPAKYAENYLIHKRRA